MPVIQAGHCLLGQCCTVGNASYSSWSLLTWAVLYCRECQLFKLVIAYSGSAVLYVIPVMQAGHCLLGQCCIIGNVRYSSWSLLTWAVLYCRECRYSSVGSNTDLDL